MANSRANVPTNDANRFQIGYLSMIHVQVSQQERSGLAWGIANLRAKVYSCRAKSLAN
jgi:hypothetical protein